MKVVKMLLLSSLAVLSNSLLAQDNVVLPFLHLNPDVRTTAVGDVRMSTQPSAYIYSDPTASLYVEDRKLFASYSLGLYPKLSGSRQSFNSLSLAYRLSPKHSVLLGSRLLGGLEVDILDDYGSLGKLKPMDFSIDLGYAYQATDQLSMYGIVSYVNSYNGTTAHVGLISLGLAYRDTMLIGRKTFAYRLGATLDNLGTKVRYGTAAPSVNPPSTVSLSAAMDTDLSAQVRLGVGLSSRYLYASDNAKKFSVALGTELTLWDTLALRAGYHSVSGGSYASLGAGYKWRNVALDAAYVITSVSDYNNLRLGLSLNL